MLESMDLLMSASILGLGTSFGRFMMSLRSRATEGISVKGIGFRTQCLGFQVQGRGPV